ncbi:isoflavone reductase-like protein [Asparagus officinalis]|uniref:isoflavone reductase-like protein n=1 Tax=Asparagus officinalis TaxID=4686 RepID=UPI00098E36A8|nr:isoflavone reductase-like protein [Asparagus officinalis]XP_020268293.1 isoflavone reductase-like protein [Asparagus officinalis]
MASKILIIGGTGYIGKFIVGASVKLGHPTFALVRDTSSSDPAKAKLLEGFVSSGVTLLKGNLHDHESLVKAIKEVDVVISAVGAVQLADQIKIVDAIKEVGNIKRFLPSEFGFDHDRVDVIGPAESTFAPKVQIRRAIEAEGTPYTIVSSNYFAGCSLPTLAQADSTGPPKDKVVIYGDGNTKAIFVNEEDVATYTIRAVDDPRTLNKVMYIRPPGDIYTHNELVSLWEKKTGKILERIYLTEEEVLQKLERAPFPINLLTAINYSVFIKGETTRIKIDPSFGVEASELYPDVKYTTVEEYISNLV